MKGYQTVMFCVDRILRVEVLLSFVSTWVVLYIQVPVCGILFIRVPDYFGDLEKGPECRELPPWTPGTTLLLKAMFPNSPINSKV